jgi:hypothetical protein
MNPAARLLALSFDSVSRRYVGDVLLVGPDGHEHLVSTAVHGQPSWSMERVARMLIGAARMA